MILWKRRSTKATRVDKDLSLLRLLSQLVQKKLKVWFRNCVNCNIASPVIF